MPVATTPAARWPRDHTLEQRDTRLPIEASLLPSLFDSAHVGMVTMDADGLVTAVTPQAEDLLGYPESELMGRSMHATMHYERPDGSPLPDSDCPITTALRESKAADGDGEIFIRSDGSTMEVSWAVAPMVVSGTRTGGVLSFYDNRAQLTAAGRQAERLAVSEAANVRLTVLAEITQVMSETPGLLAGVTDLVHRLVPVLADWAVIGFYDELSGAFERVALAHRDPVAEAGAADTLGLIGRITHSSTGPFAEVLRSPGIRRHPDSDLPSSAGPGPGRWGLFERFGANDGLTAPLRARGRTLGAITIARIDPHRPFVPDDVAFLTDLASRIAFAVDNARLLDEQRHRAEQMQRALLPDLPAERPGLDLAGAYYPANDVAQVGGDWYDAFNLPDDTVAIVIGDVAGHDLHAATRMGAVRHKLRAIAGDRNAPPAETVSRLDRVLQRFAPDDLVTLVYATLRRAEEYWVLEWSNAGHPPPLLLLPDGSARFLQSEADPPIGVGDLSRTQLREVLPAGSTLVLYSDGLVERAEESLDVGLDRLLTRSAGVTGSPEQVCRTIVESVDPSRSDDIALLAVRLWA